MLLDESVSIIKNVGKERLRRLNKLGIFTVSDLIHYYPRGYNDLSHISQINEIIPGETAVIKVKIIADGEVLSVRGLLITKIKAADLTGSITLSWFNQPYLKNQFIKNKEYVFYGKADFRYGEYTMDSPGYEAADRNLTAGRIIPVYPLTEGLSQKMFLTFMKTALDLVHNEILENLPENIIKKYNLCKKSFAVFNVHFPENDETFFLARRRLVFDELLSIQICLFQIKGLTKKSYAPKFFDINDNDFIKALPFSLTSGQNQALNDIKTDFKTGYSMNRLLQGDVGSGKTAVAAAACFIAVKNGYQAAIMAPTETLARQHYKTMKNIFDKFNIKTVLLTGSLTLYDKRLALSDISSGFAQVVTGTHAVIQKNVKFNNLALVITDEQHRFGVRQRTHLAEKSSSPHVLVMTATPIPRTLALILYGDLDISTIMNLPPGRQKIETYSVDSSYAERIYKFIKKEINDGRQAYIICPMIEENENLNIKSVIKYAEELKNNWFGDKLAVLHGKMKDQEKNEIMDDFNHNRYSVLISTTVVEVGIDVPNANIILIENAERFGLSQLHQLRGRVGRGEHKSYCILISDNKTETVKNRLKAMKETSCGFKISQLDLSMRGPGDFFGTRQHGLPEMKIANLYKDGEILKEAQEAAREIYENDLYLNKPENIRLKEMINKTGIVL